MTRPNAHHGVSQPAPEGWLAVEKPFLNAKIFHGLKQLRPWFDSPVVEHFDSWCLDLIDRYRSLPSVSFCASHSVPAGVAKGSAPIQDAGSETDD